MSEAPPKTSQIDDLLKEADRLYNDGALKEAFAIYEKLAAHRPPLPQVIARLGRIMVRWEHLDAAERWIAKSLAIAPHQHAMVTQLARLCFAAGRLSETLTHIDRALSIKPDSTEALLTKVFALMDLKRFDESLAVLDQLLTIAPDNASAINAKADALLLAGDYVRGWPLYEWRWQRQEIALHEVAAGLPLWTGQGPLAGKVILIHPELGHGDFFMMARYFPLLAARGAQVVVLAPAPMLSLVRELKGITVLPMDTGALHADFQCPVMSLPRAFGTTLESIPSGFPYLHAPATHRQKWASRLAPTRFQRVGLVWSGKSSRNIDQFAGRRRSIPVAALRSLIELPFEFHSLQKEVREGDAPTLWWLRQITQHQAALDDFADTAALIDQMDLVISIDTSVAHLAGALGKPLWVMLPYAGDFRWLSTGPSTPWYPAARLFRQPRPGDWDSVVCSVTTELAKLAQGPASAHP